MRLQSFFAKVVLGQYICKILFAMRQIVTLAQIVSTQQHALMALIGGGPTRCAVDW
jgi:hypothetical protein